MDFIKPCFGVRTPTGEGKCGRLKTAWRWTMMTELREMGLLWNETQASESDGPLWEKNYLGGLRFSRDEED